MWLWYRDISNWYWYLFICEKTNKKLEENISNQMVSLFFLCFEGDTPSTDLSIKKSFGLIVVPTGNGKAPLVKKECNRFPRGVPYYNVCEPEMFTKELAEEIRMRVGPSNILDLVLGHFSSDLFLCYHLPG